MKWKILIFHFTCLLMQKLVSGQDKDGEISMTKISNLFVFKCTNGEFKYQNETTSPELKLIYEEKDSKEYMCVKSGDPQTPLSTILVKFRTCDNCIELDAPSLSAIIVGNLVATFLIAFAVYSITRQPKGRNFTGNKASDKVNLLPNGEGDTYQPLTPGQNSEYSRLDGVRKK
ncbi:T-cell surface glycoprotein CD3 delta chain-like [Clarias gariepinus]|uniref:T-cell surface glycoprotein CD3 delta chain-like n=1 Tax=Clarias gariepinus TaxID=13013 RepID=UPI00234D0CA7|nr:T-cell surface glycoprotein CD3 delta chain-like [Clarias gariepinus]XP_053363540.1 T-cell surface glycoprotein CD3 delta chain-like [Clarias gariepinus]